MAEIKRVPSRYSLELNATEMNLVTRALAYVAGYEILFRKEDKDLAKQLNTNLLEQRAVLVNTEQKVVTDALRKTKGDQQNETEPERRASRTGR